MTLFFLLGTSQQLCLPASSTQLSPSVRSPPSLPTVWDCLVRLGIPRKGSSTEKQHRWSRSVVSSTCRSDARAHASPWHCGRALRSQGASTRALGWTCAQGIGGRLKQLPEAQRQERWVHLPVWHVHRISPFGEASGTIGCISVFMGDPGFRSLWYMHPRLQAQQSLGSG